MKTPAVLPLLAVICLAMPACAPLRKSASEAIGRAPLAGGYRTAEDTRESASTAAFAAREESRRTGTPIRVVKVLKSETQVVAGTNFRLRIAAQRNGASTETAEALVFRDLGGKRHLTSWRWIKD